MSAASSQPLFLLVTNTAGDVRRFWLPLLRQARAAGFRLCCAVPAGGGDAAGLAAEAGLCGQNADLAELRFFPLERKGMNGWRDMQTCRALRQIFVQEKPKMVLAATIKCVVYGGLAWRLARAEVSGHAGIKKRWAEAGSSVWAAWRAVMGCCTRKTTGERQEQTHHASMKRCARKAAGQAEAECLAGASSAEPRFFAAITGLGYAFEADSLPKRLLRALVCRLYHSALAQASGIFFQNQADVDVFRAAGIIREKKKGAAGLRPPVCITAGVGVDLARFQPAPLPPLPPQGPLIFLLAARLLLAKGIAEYAAAAQMLRQRWPASAARFLLIGPLEQGAGAVTRAQLDGWLAQGALEYGGAVADVRPALRAAHVLVLPSWREGRPTVIMEGFAMGRPAVVCDVAGCRDTVRQGVEGLLTPPHDAAVLAGALESLLRAPQRVPVLAAAARRAAERRCDARAVAAGMLAFMNRGQ